LTASSQLTRHGEQIQELFRLVRSLPTISDFDQFRADTQAAVRDLVRDFQSLERGARKAEALRDDFTSFSTCVDDCVSQLKTTTGHVQTIASAYASLAKTSARLDSDLPRTLFNTSQHVHLNFRKIFDSLKDLRNQLSDTSPRSDRGPAAADETPKIDLSKLQLRGESYTMFDDPPDLPELHKFVEITEPVDYIYELVPKLQSILRCHHEKLAILDRPAKDLQDTLERVRTSTVAMARDLDELGPWPQSRGRRPHGSRLTGNRRRQLELSTVSGADGKCDRLSAQ
jgi:hypothetical protein